MGCKWQSGWECGSPEELGFSKQAVTSEWWVPSTIHHATLPGFWRDELTVSVVLGREGLLTALAPEVRDAQRLH